MASFDVVSLFTNIPIDQIISIPCEMIFANSSFFNSYERVSFTEISQLTCTNSHFLFNNNIYIQIEGVAMGSPLGLTLANLFLCHFESAPAVDQYPSYFKPLVYTEDM